MVSYQNHRAYLCRLDTIDISSTILFCKEKTKYPHHLVKYRLRRCEVMPYGIVKFCASHKMKLSVPLTSADASRCEASLHCGSNFTCPQAHLVQKPSCKMQDGFCGPSAEIRTRGLLNPISRKLAAVHGNSRQFVPFRTTLFPKSSENTSTPTYPKHHSREIW